jgi:hypothetical protein
MTQAHGLHGLGSPIRKEEASSTLEIVTTCQILLEFFVVFMIKT